MIVYRVEHAERFEGPYHSDALIAEWDKNNANATWNRPMPEWTREAEDKLDDAPVPWRYGFHHEGAFRSWFDDSDERAALARLGYVLSVYDSADVVKSRCNRNYISFTDDDGTKVKADTTTWIVALFSVLSQEQRNTLRRRLRARQDKGATDRA